MPPLPKVWQADAEAGDVGPGAGEVYTCNSTELRGIGIDAQTAGMFGSTEKEHLFSMHAAQPVGGVPLDVVRRPAARGAAAKAMKAIRHVLRVVHEERAVQPEQLWELPAADENNILSQCCP